LAKQSNTKDGLVKFRTAQVRANWKQLKKAREAAKQRT